MGTLSEIGHSESFKIRTHEIDLNKQIKLTSLLQLMQEASMSNAMDLNVSIWDLEEKSQSWVLVKKEIKIYSLPRLGDTITITTYPSGFERLFAYRDFIVKDNEGIVMAEASSSWILMDIVGRTVVKPKFTIPIPTDVNVLPRPSFNLKKVNDPHTSKDFCINWFDLDWNNHVNNVFLLKCFLESVTEKRIRSQSVKKISIQFKSEGLLYDQLTSHCQEIENNTTAHSMIRNTDNKTIALAQIEWK